MGSCRLTQELNPVVCHNLEEWDVVWGVKEGQEGGDIYNYGWFSLLYGKNQQNIVKQ